MKLIGEAANPKAFTCPGEEKSSISSLRIIPSEVTSGEIQSTVMSERLKRMREIAVTGERRGMSKSILLCAENHALTDLGAKDQIHGRR